MFYTIDFKCVHGLDQSVLWHVPYAPVNKFQGRIDDLPNNTLSFKYLMVILLAAILEVELD